MSASEVHLVDGTYELFRHFYGAPPRAADGGGEIGAVRGVVSSVLSMLSSGATHVGVATDHVIESFRNQLWPGYKTGEGIDELLMAQFPLLETALEALGVVVWAMVELEADDALASAAAVADDDAGVDRVLICTPDKDLAQCVRGTRVVQLDRRKDVITNEDKVRERYGIGPASIPDWLALVGDSADGFPGLQGWGKQSASKVLGHYEHLEAVPADAADWEPGVRSAVRSAPKLAARLAEDMADALLFRDLATLRVDRSLLAAIGDLRWTGPTAEFDDVAQFLRDPELASRATRLAARR
jgi:5'-3' exonuclease